MEKEDKNISVKNKSLEIFLEEELSKIDSYSLNSKIEFLASVLNKFPFNGSLDTNKNLSELIQFVYNREFNIRELEKEIEVLRKDSITDPLSNLYNRRIFDKETEFLYNDFVRNSRNVSIAYIDFDDFKFLNDTYSHEAGDKVIRSFGNVLNRNAKRNLDWACRLGGEEFALILPDCSLNNGIKVMEKIRSNFHKKIFHLEDSLGEKVCYHQTISYGIGQFSNTNISVKKHLNFIDRALYMSKKNGKNQGHYITDLEDNGSLNFVNVEKKI